MNEQPQEALEQQPSLLSLFHSNSFFENERIDEIKEEKKGIAAAALAQLNSLLLSLNKLKKFSFWAEKKELVELEWVKSYYNSNWS